MKKTLILTLALFVLACTQSCSGDEINRNESIFKDPDPATRSEFDKWLLKNFTQPYNIRFKYKMQDMESDMQYELVPATVANAIAFAKLIKHLWMEVYDEVAGTAFTKRFIPRIIHLVGSGAYNSNNTVLLGTAEGGLKVTLYRINDLNPETVTIEFMTDRYLRTMYHEFAHILHQTKNYSEEFAKISNNNYVSDDWSNPSNNDALAYSLGFVSRYSRKEANEDFVEILSIFVVYGQTYWDALLREAGKNGAKGAEIITRKFEIVRSYLQTAWNIDIFELRRVFEAHAASMHQLDLKNL